MIFTVSTVKDSRANIERFVEQNLRSGADHMFVFLEADTDGVLSWLRRHPHVTAVRTDARYWVDGKPDNLNTRQVINANLVNCLLTPFGWADWLFHIDGDECLDIDKSSVEALPADVGVVSLEPVETVSTSKKRLRGRYFKRLLRHDELCLLTSLGLLPEPDNEAYFHGHVDGKSGIRPNLALGLRVHHVRSKGSDDDLLPYRADWLRVLHYDAPSPEDFVRKWRAHATGGPAGFREERQVLAAAATAVVRDPVLSTRAKERYLHTLYARHVEDPVETLLELGFTVEVDDSRHRYEPAGLSTRQQRTMRRLLGTMLRQRKSPFRVRSGLRSLLMLMRRVRRQHASVDPRTARRLAAAISRATSELAASGAPRTEAHRVVPAATGWEGGSRGPQPAHDPEGEERGAVAAGDRPARAGE